MTRLILALLALAAPAMAQTPAAIWPTRDVVVIFDAPAQMGGMTMQMAFSADTRMARMDMPQGFGIVDYNGKQMTMVMPQQRMFMVMAMPGDMPVSTDLNDHDFTRLGARTVAGYACTDWRIQPRNAGANQQAVVCLTDDGVVLRTEAGGSPGFVTEAKEVRYGALDPSLFRVPDGFQKMEMPGMAQQPRQ